MAEAPTPAPDQPEETTPARRFTVEDLERFLSFLSWRKRLQDTFYGGFEILEIDWDKERILTRRLRPRPLPPVDETLHFNFLENFWKYHHGEIDELVAR